MDNSNLEKVVVTSELTAITVNNDSEDVIHDACVAVGRAVDTNDIGLQIRERKENTTLVFNHDESNNSSVIRFYAYLMNVGSELNANVEIPL